MPWVWVFKFCTKSLCEGFLTLDKTGKTKSPPSGWDLFANGALVFLVLKRGSFNFKLWAWALNKGSLLDAQLGKKLIKFGVFAFKLRQPNISSNRTLKREAICWLISGHKYFNPGNTGPFKTP